MHFQTWHDRIVRSVRSPAGQNVGRVGSSHCPGEPECRASSREAGPGFPYTVLGYGADIPGPVPVPGPGPGFARGRGRAPRPRFARGRGRSPDLCVYGPGAPKLPRCWAVSWPKCVGPRAPLPSAWLTRRTRMRISNKTTDELSFSIGRFQVQLTDQILGWAPEREHTARNGKCILLDVR